ncbi:MULTISPECIES: hypothetical protein [Mycobacterium]|uniref:hypothetical protein n=1 Tax=Mycobacterium TaxID=1763 RepID=UPI0009F3389D|nr:MULTISPECIES: hypothetical protein [Mycobacterium]MCG7610254.1 Mce protein [Mycobacterium sp. CnD-18-1]
MAVDDDASHGELKEHGPDGAEPEHTESPGTEPDRADAGKSAKADATPDASATPGARSGLRTALVAGAATVVALTGVSGWLGFRSYETHLADRQRELFLSVGRQGALNLTTLKHTEIEADVQRILDAATGGFHDDFQKRAPAFVEVVKKAQSTSEGTITEAGLESQTPDSAQVLVAVSVKTSNAGAPEQDPRAWRMRIGVQKVGDETKVSNVEFVP